MTTEKAKILYDRSCQMKASELVYDLEHGYHESCFIEEIDDF